MTGCCQKPLIAKVISFPNGLMSWVFSDGPVAITKHLCPLCLSLKMEFLSVIACSSEVSSAASGIAFAISVNLVAAAVIALLQSRNKRMTILLLHDICYLT